MVCFLFSLWYSGTQLINFLFSSKYISRQILYMTGLEVILMQNLGNYELWSYLEILELILLCKIWNQSRNLILDEVVPLQNCLFCILTFDNYMMDRNQVDLKHLSEDFIRGLCFCINLWEFAININSNIWSECVF